MKIRVGLIGFCLFFSSLSQAISLFNDNVYRPLIADRKAYLPGDVLTVIVMETSNAQSSADLASGKEIKTALEARYNKNRHEVAFGLEGKGRAAAKTGRNGKIKASLTVRIKAILPGGSYLVEGHQLIRINGEQQTILLSGVVRQEDISPQNTVLSTRLADAQITYTGDGSVSDSQRRNYVYKLLSFIGLV
ncbi:flagellar basal body L-ring protein FlgH [Legionella fairfieldensis]|uniref:flagellar basal body L-ring protein FlgH n=1 Tax=Legionella fairfieldensis TaxID=45064 RepID=UPI00068888A8|nr:flagellar basal body L-ring protein FlgH [Legionella fairfieldensis]